MLEILWQAVGIKKMAYALILFDKIGPRLAKTNDTPAVG